MHRPVLNRRILITALTFGGFFLLGYPRDNPHRVIAKKAIEKLPLAEGNDRALLEKPLHRVNHRTATNARHRFQISETFAALPL